jgi:putative ABC transport system substrate-binding protein
MRRREFIVLMAGTAALPILRPFPARAQQVRRVAVLNAIAADDQDAKPRMTAFLRGLRELGWTEGRNIRVDNYWVGSAPDRIPSYAAEIVGQSPDVIIAATTPVALALARATGTIPIVFVQVSDPVGSGLVPSLAYPGGNMTGFTNLEYSISGKWLEALKEIAPQTKRVGLIFNPDTAPARGSYYLDTFQEAATTLKLKPSALPVQSEAEIKAAIAGLAREPGGAFAVMSDSFTAVHRDLIIALAAEHRLPAIYPFRFFAISGGLVSYGIDNIDLYQRAAGYVDRIFKGAKPADLPIQQPTKYELVVNLLTAKKIGIEVPENLLARADEVIE